MLADEQGQARWVVAAGMDITEQRRAEQAFRQSEETARALLNATPDATFLLDTTGRVLALNAAAAKRFATTIPELLGKDVFEFMPREVAAARRQKIEQVVSTGQATYLEDTWAGRHMDSHIYPILSDEGQVSRIGVYTRDITDRSFVINCGMSKYFLPDFRNYFLISFHYMSDCQ